MTALTVRERIAQKRGDIAANKSKGVRTYRWKPGKTLFRILPDPETGTIAMKQFGKMWLKSFDNQQKFSIGDRQITYGETDPIRESIFAAMKEAPTEEIRDHYKGMLASPKNVFQVLILSVNGAPDSDAPADEPQIVELSDKQFDNILAQFEAYLENDEDHDLASAARGHVFSCEKSGTGFDTTYQFLATPKAAPVKPDLVAKQHDLDAWIKGEFEGLEQKALEFIGKLNGAAGISVAPVEMQITNQSSGSTESTAGGTEDTVTDATDDAVDAEYEEVDETADAPAEPETASKPDAGETADASGDSDEIDDILAGLE